MIDNNFDKEFQVSDWEEIDKEIEPITKSLRKKFENETERLTKEKWRSLSKGLLEHRKKEFIKKEFENSDYRIEEIKMGIRVCKRLNTPYEINEKGMLITDIDKLPTEEKVREVFINLEKEKKKNEELKSFIENINRAIPYEKKFDTFDYKLILFINNEEIKDLEKYQDKFYNRKKNIEFEMDILLSLFKLIQDKKIEV